MATNHTENYQLNLWEPTDTFSRAEINENTQKLDAALGGKADASALASLSQTVSALIQPTPLLDLTLAENAGLITVPITAEYRQKYRKLLLYFDLQISGAASATILVRNTDGELADFYTTLYPRIANLANQEAFSELILELSAPVVLFFTYSQRSYPSSNPNYSRTIDGLDHYSFISSLDWSQVSQLEFKPNSGSVFLAGGQVRMYGLL